MSRTIWFAAAVLACWPITNARATDVTIEIRGNGTTAQYIQTPAAPGNPPDKQLNVVIAVGDKVIWKNRGDAQHTANSDVKIPDGAGGFKFLFEPRIDAGASKDYTFTAADYTAARTSLGIADGQPVHLGYYCANHPATMGGKLVLVKTRTAVDEILKAAQHSEGRKAE